jgi:hypothetical protein
LRGRAVGHYAEMKNDLEVRTKRFALDVIKFVTSLKLSRPVEVIARQVLKSGTSIGANYREATRAESRSDFIGKQGAGSRWRDDRCVVPLIIE